MPIYKGSTLVASVLKGSTSMQRVYKGSTLVFEKDGGGGEPGSGENPIYDDVLTYIGSQTSDTLGGSSYTWDDVDLGEAYEGRWLYVFAVGNTGSSTNTQNFRTASVDVGGGTIPLNMMYSSGSSNRGLSALFAGPCPEGTIGDITQGNSAVIGPTRSAIHIFTGPPMGYVHRNWYRNSGTGTATFDIEAVQDKDVTVAQAMTANMATTEITGVDHLADLTIASNWRTLLGEAARYPIGVYSISSPTAGILASYTFKNREPEDRSVYFAEGGVNTFTDVPIGDADAGRMVFLGIVFTGTGTTPLSVTYDVGDGPEAMAFIDSGSGSAHRMSIAYAIIPSGTQATFAVDAGAGSAKMSVQVLTKYGMTGTLRNVSPFSNVADPSGTMDVMAGDFIIQFAMSWDNNLEIGSKRHYSDYAPGSRIIRRFNHGDLRNWVMAVRDIEADNPTEAVSMATVVSARTLMAAFY